MCDDQGRPRLLVLSEGQVSDFKGAAYLLSYLPPARAFLADRGYDADWLREGLRARQMLPCIPVRKNRRVPVEYDKTLYKQRHKVEIMFGRLKDWRRIAMRYDRCAHTFLSAIALASAFIFYLKD